MKKSLLFFLLFFSGAISYGQIQIISGNSSIAPIYSSTTTTRVDVVNITFQLTGAYVAANSSVALTIVAGTITAAVPTFLNGTATTTIAFPANVWPGAGAVIQTTVPINVISTNRASRIINDEVGQIQITGHPESFHTITVSNSANTSYNPTKSFWIEIGANFDLIDGIQANNFFSGVFFHNRDIANRRLFSQSDNLGIFAGIYESKTISSNQEQDFSFRNYYDSSSFINGVTDSIKVFKGVGTIINKRIVKNVGLFFSPQLRLTNGSANKDGLHVFASAWFDLQWQKISEDRVFNQIRKQDSFRVHINDLENYRAVNYKKETDIRSHYFGLGLPVLFRETIDDDITQLFINPVIGFSNQPTEDFTRRSEAAEMKGLIRPDREWKPFYIVQFRLNEEKYGISFTGEIRGLITKGNAPFVSLALSKKFDLNKFIEYGKK